MTEQYFGGDAVEGSAYDAIQNGSRGMVFLHYGDPRFLKGMAQHGVLDQHGYRVLSIGLSDKPFSSCFPNMERANQTGAPFHVDRILGGAPYMDLTGIEEMAGSVKDNPAFLGFQAHEWGHGSILDLRRIQERFTKAGIPFDAEHFQPFRNRSKAPFFSSGDYEVYKDLPREIRTVEELADFFRGFLSYFSARTHGQLMTVNGYFQLYHFATKIGVRSLVAEVGNQVPLSCMQTAAARGAARQANKPFGIYYEPWGGKPPSCTSALPWSPWFGEDVPLEEADQGLGLAMGRDLGSSRSLQKRLLYYSWLSGAAFVSEEWGPENYFFDWTNFTLSEYGRISLDFQQLVSRYPRPCPVVPLALVLPPDVPGIDNLYLTEAGEDFPLFKCLAADTFHRNLRHFAHRLLAARPHARGLDDSNLTPSPYIGSFDVLGHDAPSSLLDQYQLVVYFARRQRDDSTLPSTKTMHYQGVDEQVVLCRDAIHAAWPFQIEGEVGCAVATLSERSIIGIFNNLGVVKEETRENYLPEATRPVRLCGRFRDVEVLCGSEFIRSADREGLQLTIPAGEIFLMSFHCNEQ